MLPVLATWLSSELLSVVDTAVVGMGSATELAALGPATMANCNVVVQSEAILQDPSNYWISVINAGRAHGLEDVRAVDPTAEGAAPVITALMHVADVLAMSADADASVVAARQHAPRRDELRLQLAVLVAEADPRVLVRRRVVGRGLGDRRRGAFGACRRRF